MALSAKFSNRKRGLFLRLQGTGSGNPLEPCMRLGKSSQAFSRAQFLGRSVTTLLYSSVNDDLVKKGMNKGTDKKK